MIVGKDDNRAEELASFRKSRRAVIVEIAWQKNI
jgi:hypothetical protein